MTELTLVDNVPFLLEEIEKDICKGYIYKDQEWFRAKIDISFLNERNLELTQLLISPIKSHRNLAKKAAIPPNKKVSLTRTFLKLVYSKDT